ncbi:MAG: flavin reductase family protein [Ruminococcaceae bacterium]|nr:flavin reductase family protein [Oscillospiraceae bacterium]
MNGTALFNLSYGVYVITVWADGKPTGCVANACMQVTSEPPKLIISLNKSCYTNKYVKETEVFAVNVLGENADSSIITEFGFASGSEVNKFENRDYIIKENLPVLKDSVAFITCKVLDEKETDTHTIFLAQVTDADNLKADTPMTYSYYHKVLKGKTSKKAPTYKAEMD